MLAYYSRAAKKAAARPAPRNGSRAPAAAEPLDVDLEALEESDGEPEELESLVPVEVLVPLAVRVPV